MINRHNLRSRLQRQERRTKSPLGICWDNLLARSPDELIPDAWGVKWLELFEPSDADSDPIERRIAEALERSANEPAPPANRLAEPSANGAGSSRE